MTSGMVTAGRCSRRSCSWHVHLSIERLEERNLLTTYSITDLGTLGGTKSAAGDINGRGQIAGEASYSGDNSGSAFLWSGGILHALGLAGSGEGVNDLG